jgi:hypothetical protein
VGRDPAGAALGHHEAREGREEIEAEVATAPQCPGARRLLRRAIGRVFGWERVQEHSDPPEPVNKNETVGLWVYCSDDASSLAWRAGGFWRKASRSCVLLRHQALGQRTPAEFLHRLAPPA